MHRLAETYSKASVSGDRDRHFFLLDFSTVSLEESRLSLRELMRTMDTPEGKVWNIDNLFLQPPLEPGWKPTPPALPIRGTNRTMEVGDAQTKGLGMPRHSYGLVPSFSRRIWGSWLLVFFFFSADQFLGLMMIHELFSVLSKAFPLSATNGLNFFL